MIGSDPTACYQELCPWLQGEDVKALLKAAMGKTGGSVHLVPVSGGNEAVGVVAPTGGMVTPSVNVLLQLSPWSVAPQTQASVDNYDDGLEGVLRMLKDLGLEDYRDRFRKERVSGGGVGEGERERVNQ